MPIPVITNFDVNASSPIDSRMVVTGASQRNGIVYKYQGLKVYQTSDNSSWVWDGSSWKRDSNGIYGGSGSLSGDTSVNFGSIAETNTCNKLSWNTNEGQNLNQYFFRPTEGEGLASIQKTSFNIEYKVDNSSGPYITINRNDTNPGGIGFGVGYAESVTESMVIRYDGRIGVGKGTNPSSDFQLGNSSYIYAPITLNNGSTFSSIGFNWFDYQTNRQKFNSSRPASQIMMDNNNAFYIRLTPNSSSTSMETRLLITPTETRLTNSIFKVNSTSYNEFVGQIRSTPVNPISFPLNRTTPNYSFSSMTNGGLYLDNTDIAISNSGKRAFAINKNLQNIQYFNNDSGESTSYVLTGSRGVRGSVINNTGFTEYIIATVSINENLSAHSQSPSEPGSFVTQLKNGKVVIIEADLIGKITKLGSNSFYDNNLKRYKYLNIYSINNSRNINLLSSTFSFNGFGETGLGFSASITHNNPNEFKFSYFFKMDGTPPNESNTILSAMVSYKITTMNDYSGDYDLVVGSFIPSQIIPD